MAIPESQLQTWSRQGSVSQSSSTYETIRNILTSPSANYSKYSTSIFLQGSYGNDTNIYSDSDVDVVIQLDSCYYRDLSDLPEDQKDSYDRAFSTAAVEYEFYKFKADVGWWLANKWGGDVEFGTKAIHIKANDSRRKADVLVAVQYRRYYEFHSITNNRYATGLCFFNSNLDRIANYPKTHSLNCTAKHQATSNRFKPMVRIFKNLRNRMVDQQMINNGLAPSYFIEGMLYNVPNNKFVTGLGDTFANCVNWLNACDRSKLLCANEQYMLLHNTSTVTWRETEFVSFLNSVIACWNGWQ